MFLSFQNGAMDLERYRKFLRRERVIIDQQTRCKFLPNNFSFCAVSLATRSNG